MCASDLITAAGNDWRLIRGAYPSGIPGDAWGWIVICSRNGSGRILL